MLRRPQIFDPSSNYYLTLLSNVKKVRKMGQNFVSLSENLNFTMANVVWFFNMWSVFYLVSVFFIYSLSWFFLLFYFSVLVFPSTFSHSQITYCWSSYCCKILRLILYLVDVSIKSELILGLILGFEKDLFVAAKDQ